ncbi:MAG: hypothetical protein WC858_00810 [Parcubacteria group bacterium]|jgi:hypothetical protein
MSEKFNPFNAEYKKVEDLPSDERANFVNLENGFIRREVLESWSEWEELAKLKNKKRGILFKIFNLPKVTAIELAETEARIFHENWKTPNAEINFLSDIMMSAFEKMVPQMRDAVNAHAYDVVFSEDSSGRLPAEIIHKAINKIYETKNEKLAELVSLDIGHDHKHHNLDSSGVKSVVSNLLIENKIENGFLYVTEYISSRATINKSFEGIFYALENVKKGDRDKKFNVAFSIIGGNNFDRHIIANHIAYAIFHGKNRIENLDFGKYSNVKSDVPLSVEQFAMREKIITNLRDEFINIFYEKETTYWEKRFEEIIGNLEKLLHSRTAESDFNYELDRLGRSLELLGLRINKTNIDIMKDHARKGLSVLKNAPPRHDGYWYIYKPLNDILEKR